LEGTCWIVDSFAFREVLRRSYAALTFVRLSNVYMALAPPAEVFG